MENKRLQKNAIVAELLSINLKFPSCRQLEHRLLLELWLIIKYHLNVLSRFIKE